MAADLCWSFSLVNPLDEMKLYGTHLEPDSNFLTADVFKTLMIHT